MFNKTSKTILTLIMSLLCISYSIHSAEEKTTKNLLKNSELKMSAGKLNNWWTLGEISADAGHKGNSSVYLLVGKKQKKSYHSFMIQKVDKLAPGKLTFTAYIKISDTVNNFNVCRIIKKNGKDVYQKFSLNKAEQANYKEWKKLKLEFDIPKEINSAVIGFDIYDTKSGVKVWIDSPSLTYKVEK